MACVGTVLLFFVAVTLFAVATSAARRRAHLRSQFYRQLASRLMGVFISGSWFSSPAVRFRYTETTVVIEPLPQRAGDSLGNLQVRLTWPAYAIQCVIQSATAPGKEPRGLTFWATKILEFESGPLRSGFKVVTADSEQRVRACLTEPVRWEIQRLSQLSHVKGIRLVIQRGAIVIERMAYPAGSDEVGRAEEFVRQALRIYDQVRLTFAQGIAFLNQDTAAVVENAICPICAERVTERLVYCRRCQTVHHFECWEYNGRCAAYGCGETVYCNPSQASISPIRDDKGASP